VHVHLISAPGLQTPQFKSGLATPKVSHVYGGRFNQGVR